MSCMHVGYIRQNAALVTLTITPCNHTVITATLDDDGGAGWYLGARFT